MNERTAADDMPQFRDTLVGHTHRCWCGRWYHEDGGSECVLVEKMTCPMHEGEHSPTQMAL